jgi:hypothetical protein|nr:MAG TPA: hypothetical protein [Caudoviricetes sp.]
MQLATTRKFGELEIQVYENPAVGHSRVQDDFWMTREQIGTALEYTDPRKTIGKIHERNKDRLDPLSTVVKMSTVEGKRTVMREVVCYNLRGVMEICRYSTQPKANAFIDFCWDVMVALMQGETVSLNRGQVSDAESRRQARFEIMTQGIEELRQSQNQLCSQMAEMEEKRRQDREALENLIHFTKADLEKAERIVSKNDIIISTIEQIKKQLATTIQQPTYQNGSYTPRKTYIQPAETSWKHDVKEMVGKISSIEGVPQKDIYNDMYKTLKKELGWSAHEERKLYAKKRDISDVYSIPLIDIVEMANDNIRSSFYCRLKDRYENDLFDPEEAKRQPHVSKRNPPMIPASMIPTRHKVEDLPSVLSPENPGGNDIKIVAEVQAVEVEAPAVEMPVVKEPKKKYYYKPSITLPIVEPIAKKLGDKTIGYWVTYAKIYDTIGVVKMDRMRKAYVRSHNKPPKATPDIFQNSDKNMKVFKEAAKIVAAAI